MIVTGEASGEMYGSRVVRALKKIDPTIHIFGIGGDLMQLEGMELLAHIRDMSFMGLIEVAKHYPWLRKVFRRCVRELILRKPDTLLVIDYPGFNLKLAKKARKNGVRVVYYISPQVWAWGKNRVTKMKSLIDQFAVIFPFEKEIYEKAGIPVSFVGHPLMEILEFNTSRKEFLQNHSLPDEKILALFPGSRKQEINKLLPTMIEAAERLCESFPCTIAIGVTLHVPLEFYHNLLLNHPDIHLISSATQALMEHAHAAIVTSGTATVETAIYQIPMAIVYKTSRVTYEIFKRLVSVNHIGMVNILAGKTIVPELIQHECTVENLVREMRPLLIDEQRRSEVIHDLGSIREKFGKPGASARVAQMVLQL